MRCIGIEKDYIYHGSLKYSNIVSFGVLRLVKKQRNYQYINKCMGKRKM